MKLTLTNKIPRPNEVYFNSLTKGEIFLDREGDYCMVLDEVEVCGDDYVNCVILSGPAIGEACKVDDKECVIPIKAELTVLEYE